LQVLVIASICSVAAAGVVGPAPFAYAARPVAYAAAPLTKGKRFFVQFDMEYVLKTILFLIAVVAAEDFDYNPQYNYGYSVSDGT
jgi:hypothetical protein